MKNKKKPPKKTVINFPFSKTYSNTGKNLNEKLSPHERISEDEILELINKIPEIEKCLSYNKVTLLDNIIVCFSSMYALLCNTQNVFENDALVHESSFYHQEIFKRAIKECGNKELLTSKIKIANYVREIAYYILDSGCCPWQCNENQMKFFVLQNLVSKYFQSINSR